MPFEVAPLNPQRLTHWISDALLHELTGPSFHHKTCVSPSLRRTAVEDARKSYTQSYTLWDIVFARVFDYTDS